MTTFEKLLLAGFAIVVARALWTAFRRRSITEGGRSYDRAGQPVRYWMFVFHYALGLALVAWLLQLGVRLPDQRINLAPLIGAYACGLPAAAALFWGLRAGEVRWHLTSYRRGRESGVYWSVLSFYVLASGLSGWLLLASDLHKGPRDRDSVTPVTAAVRREMSGRNAALRDVAVDPRTRIVCGLAGSGAEARRFFGRAFRDSVVVRIDGGEPGFTQAHGRFCAGATQVPSWS